MLTVIIFLKALVEFILYLFVGKAIVYFLCFGNHQGNSVYNLFKLLLSPIEAFCRSITPSFIHNKHIPTVTFFIFFWLLIVLIGLKVILGDPSDFNIQ
ncbi:MAG: hypothetical protein CBC42_00545 [Betaproteobacteria bacterium TMED82]|nr:MAG: hypothetical protein CBC42_00545 [Betaproteobacteria bacterium TMED82]